MALFKVYYGDESSLPETINDGYGYVVINEDEHIGTWYIDVNPNHVINGGTRYEISAKELVDEDGNFYKLEDLVLRDDLLQDFLSSIVTATDQSDIREAINVASIQETTPKKINLSILNEQWSSSDPTYYIKEINIEETPGVTTTLKCYVPPLIVWNQTGSQQFFSAIAKIEINDAKNKITCYIPKIYSNVFNGVSAGALLCGITIVDYR